MNPLTGTTYTHWWTLLGLVLAGALASSRAPGQEDTAPGQARNPQPTTQVASEPFWLRVTAKQVNLRSRPDANSVVVARAEQNTVLRAVGSEYGWYRILPPAGVFSWASADYIERHGQEEGVVTVRSGGLRVRVGSLVHDLDPATSDVQLVLPRGTPVRILGTQGSWLKIVPPEGVHVFVSDQHVQRVSDDVAARLQAAQTSTSQPVVATETPPGAADTPAETREVRAPDLKGPWGQRLVLIETAIAAEAHRPGLEQQWSTLLARLRPVAAQQEDPTVARLAAAWITQLEDRCADQDAVRTAAEIRQRAARERAQHEREEQRIKRLQEQVSTRPAFAARGVLLHSHVAGDRDGKQGYILQDPATDRVAARLDLGSRVQTDLTPLVGKYVGVRGQLRFDRDLGADVVLVESIEILKRSEPATQPARRKP